MSEVDFKEFRLGISLAAGFAAFQAAALFICVSIMVLEDGPIGIFEGGMVWMFAQIVVLSLFVLPTTLALRILASRLISNAKITAIIFGTCAGVLFAVVVIGMGHLSGAKHFVGVWRMQPQAQ